MELVKNRFRRKRFNAEEGRDTENAEKKKEAEVESKNTGDWNGGLGSGDFRER
jgi:hypothetical protein